MDEQQLRKQCNIQGAALLIYRLIMNGAVIAVMLVAMFANIFTAAFQGVGMDMDAIMESVMDSSGWGYLLAIAIGMLLLLLWKKKAFIRQEIFHRGAPMTVPHFFVVLCFFMSGQLLYQLAVMAADALLAPAGVSVMDFLESNSVDTDSLSMLLYVGFGAPIFEEILFRGVVMRSLEPHGKKFAIFLSAMLFGLYHGSPLQSLYAMLVGLVLGYVAMEHNVLWAMALHMFNNLIFADELPRLLENLPYGAGDAVMQLLTIGFFVAAVILAIVKRRRIAALWKRGRIEKWQLRGWLRAPWMWVLTVMCLLDMAVLMLLLFL